MGTFHAGALRLCAAAHALYGTQASTTAKTNAPARPAHRTAPAFQAHKSKAFSAAASTGNLVRLFDEDGKLKEDARHWMQPIATSSMLGASVGPSTAESGCWRDLCAVMQATGFESARQRRLHGVDYFNDITPPGVPPSVGLEWLLQVRHQLLLGAWMPSRTHRCAVHIVWPGTCSASNTCT